MRARDVAEPLATLPVTVAVDPGRLSFVIQAAVYRRDMPVETVDERRQAFKGMVGVVIHMDELMGNLLGPQFGSGFHLTVHDAGFSNTATRA